MGRPSIFGEDLLDHPEADRAIQGLIDEGIPLEVIVEKIGERVPEAARQAGAILLERLKGMADEMLAQYLEARNGFRSRMREKWGRPLDLLRMLIELAREVGELYCRRYRRAVTTDPLFISLHRLHARACLVADEVHELLSAGFASGAHARWRTLHEVAVVGLFLLDKGREVAKRYLLFDVVASCKAAEEYREFSEALGLDPIDEAEYQEMREARAELRTRFGPAFIQGDWGWAAEALGTKGASFVDIEKAAGLRHLRPYFRMACHSNHAGVKGMLFDLGQALCPPGRELPIAGASDAGLVDPGCCAAISLHQSTIALITHRQPTFSTLMVSQALGLLVDEIQAAFAEAGERLEEQARKAHEGRKGRRKGRGKSGSRRKPPRPAGDTGAGS